MKVWLNIKNDPISQTWFPGYKKIWPNMMMHVHCFIIMNHFFDSPWLNQHFPLTQRLHVWNNSQQIDHTNRVSQAQEGQSWWWNNTPFFLLQRLGWIQGAITRGRNFALKIDLKIHRCFAMFTWQPDSVGGFWNHYFPKQTSAAWNPPSKNKSWRFGLVLRWYICYVFIYHTYAPNGTGIFTYITNVSQRFP